MQIPKDSLPEQDISAQDEISETQINIDELLVEKKNYSNCRRIRLEENRYFVTHDWEIL